MAIGTIVPAAARRRTCARREVSNPGVVACDDCTMDAAGLRAWCLQQPGTVEDFPFGPEHSVFKVAGRMFALSALERTPLEVSVKCEPELAQASRRSYHAVRPGYHLNKRHWNTITL